MKIIGHVFIKTQMLQPLKRSKNLHLELFSNTTGEITSSEMLEFTKALEINKSTYLISEF